MINSCYLGDVRDGLRAMASAGVRARTCVTSPPYWGLRDYGVAGQLGLEPTVDEYVANMVDVFRLVRDVLADDGTLWLNLGDCYAAQCGGTHQPAETLAGGIGGKEIDGGRTNRGRHDGYNPTRNASAIGLKHKDLVGMPWRVAFALQADGWWLRQDIVWAKPNPMPESIRDRCTKSHEYLFLLSKRERYYFDADAISEPAINAGKIVKTNGADGYESETHDLRTREGIKRGVLVKDRRNRRSVWTIPTEPFSEAHFATFPTALVEPCILAGSAVDNVVLDPFLGSGTVAQVAQALGRSWVGCELNPEYHAMIARRTRARGLALA